MSQLRKQGLLPKYQLDITEGDLYFNNGKYHEALKLYQAALEAAEALENDTLCMEQMHRLISTYDCIHNEVGKADMVKRLLDKARLSGNSAMESIALFNMGKSLYLQGDKDRGYKIMLDALNIMEQCEYRLKYDNLRYDYNTLILYYMRDCRYEEAYKLLDKAECIWDADNPDLREVDELPQREQKILLAYRTVILYNLGQKEAAAETYHRFLQVQPHNTTHDYIVMPYLFETGSYDAVIDMNRSRETRLKASGDTVNYHMVTIKRSLGNAYHKKGMTDSAAVYYKQLASLIDALKAEEQKSSALELAAIYEAHEKDKKLAQQSEDLRLRTLLISFLAVLLAIAAVLLGYIFRKGCEIRRKNDSLANEIIEISEYKQRFYDKRKENMTLKKTIQAMVESNKNADVESMESASTCRYGAASVKPKPESDVEIWDRIENDIITEQLYLNPDFSRETILNRYGIPKNRFAALFRENAATSFSRYINNLRLDYAVRLMNESESYALEWVAIKCGIPSSTTFYRLFSERYGLTPNEYRKRHLKPSSQK